MSRVVTPPYVRAVVSVELDEPVLASATYHLLRQYARAHGLDRSGRVEVRLEVSFLGRPHAAQLEGFRENVRSFTVAQVDVLEEDPE